MTEEAERTRGIRQNVRDMEKKREKGKLEE